MTFDEPSKHPPYPGKRWGNWQFFDGKEFDDECWPGPWTLAYWPLDRPRRWLWYIDLETCQDSAGILDWIYQARTHFDGQDLVDLLQALYELLNPQANFCSWGMDKKANPVKVIKQNLIRTSEREPIQ